MPLVSFYSPWKQQKSRGSFIFLGGIEREQWHEMDEGRVMKVLGSLANYHFGRYSELEQSSVNLTIFPCLHDHLYW